MNALAGGVLLALLTALSISVTNVASRLHFDAGSNPATFLVWRYVLFVAVLALLVWRSARPLLPRERRAHLLCAGLLNVVGAGSLAFSIARIPVALAITILYLFPCITVVGDALLARRRPNAFVLAALLLALAGLALALDLGAGEGQADPTGVAFAFVAACGIAGSMMWSERRLGALDGLVRLYGLNAVGLVAVLVLPMLGADLVWPFETLPRGASLLAATTGFMIAMAAMFAAIARIGAGRTAILMNIEPPATVLLAGLLLGESLRGLQLAGIALVLLAVLLAQLGGGPALAVLDGRLARLRRR